MNRRRERKRCVRATNPPWRDRSATKADSTFFVKSNFNEIGSNATVKLESAPSSLAKTNMHARNFYLQTLTWKKLEVYIKWSDY